MARRKLLPIIDYYEQKRQEWWDGGADMQSAKQQHDRNVAAIRDVLRKREDPDRPLSVLVVHGSGRHPVISCAHELSNSQLLLERGLELGLEEWNGKVEVDRLILRELFLEPCNNCVATASALCNFPCSCFPGDDISTKIYPLIIKCDVILLSTGVNQGMVSSRLKILLDRLISVDGGYFIEDLPKKSSVWRTKMIQHSMDVPVYDQRMFGRVAGYFVTSKDLLNTHETQSPLPERFERLTYEDLVIGSLSIQGAEYGWYHGDPFYVMAGADPDVEYAYDKERHSKNEESHERAKEVVLASLALATQFRKDPPEFDGIGGRIGRT